MPPSKVSTSRSSMAEGSGSILPTATAAAAAAAVEVVEEEEEEEEVCIPTTPSLHFPAHCQCYRIWRWRKLC